jgi:anti-sigma regulatory factor (Ser/Thr protein kinase)
MVAQVSMECIELPIAREADVISARRRAREYAAAVGFDDRACEEILLVVSELGHNLVTHAAGGTLLLSPLPPGTPDETAGLSITSTDHGTGLGDAPHAFADGYSTGGSLGYGLGTVNRLMDAVTIDANSDTGTRIRCERWIRHARAHTRPTHDGAPLDFGAASRALPGVNANGDTFIIIQWALGALVGVIDGVGHGVEAHRAACAARCYLEAHFDRPLTDLFAGVERACHGTRGVVMALARFDFLPEEAHAAREGALRISFASIGNIEARIFGGTDRVNLLVRRGILGMPASAPKPLVSTAAWCADHILILHSDGVRSHWSFDSFPEFITLPADQVAATLLHRMARAEDDATVLVIKNNPLAR